MSRPRRRWAWPAPGRGDFFVPVPRYAAAHRLTVIGYDRLQMQ